MVSGVMIVGINIVKALEAFLLRRH